MGYELDRLMQLYGVSTPTLASAIEKPIAPTAPTQPSSSDASLTDWDKYNSLKAQYDLDTAAYQKNLANYDANQAAYDQYKADYQNRLLNTPMYSAAQYQTKPTGDYWSSQLSGPQYNLATAETVPVNKGVAWGPAGGGIFSPFTTSQGLGASAPSDFNWIDYVNKNPDLYAAGIDTPQEAAAHYNYYGKNENRAGAPVTTTPTPATNTSTISPADYIADMSRLDPNMMMGFYAEGGPVDALASKYDVDPDDYDEYAKGGPVHMEYGGLLSDPNRYSDVSGDGMLLQPPRFATINGSAPKAAPAAAVPIQEKAAPAPVATPGNVAAMADRYGISEARARALSEGESLKKMMAGALSSPEQDDMSKADMYFRLASAMASPTKTGRFMENVGLAGQQMSEYARTKREEELNKMKLRLEAQKYITAAAKEDLAAALATEKGAREEDWKKLEYQQKERGMQSMDEYRKALVAEKAAARAGKAGGAASPESALRALKTVGFDPASGKDDVETLIKASTSGGLETGTARIASMFNVSTPGQKAIQSLKTIESQLVSDMLGGKFGNQISDKDVEFIKQQFGLIGDSMTPADVRIKAWDQARRHLLSVAGLEYTPVGEEKTPAKGSKTIDFSNLKK